MMCCIRNGGLVALLVLLTLAGCGKRETYVQRGGSMAPTIKPDETVEVDYAAYKNLKPQRGDIVLFTPPPQAGPEDGAPLAIRAGRIIGLPGDLVSVENSALYVNSNRAGYQFGNRRSIYPPAMNSSGPTPTYPLTVPEGAYFICGDSPNAKDSRHWGVLPAGNVSAKVTGKD